jgi:Mce-associated membrane protein
MAEDAVAPAGELNVQPEAPESTTSDDGEQTPPPTDDDADTRDYEHEVAEHGTADKAESRKRHALRAVLASLVIAIAIVGVASWLSYRAHESRAAQQQREIFLQVGRQGALNLTTISWQSADADIQRILSSATGTFYDDFSKRAQPFIDVVKQAKSESVGSITQAAVESETDNEAKILVAITVKTTNAGAAEQTPRSWRMRLDVQRIGSNAKIADVGFVV